MSELKCCPFCGEKPKIATCDWGYSVKEYWCYCSSCGCETQKYHSKEDAIEQWNTRTTMANIVEKLEEREKYLENAMKESYENGNRFSEEKAMNERVAIRYAINIVKQEINNGLE